MPARAAPPRRASPAPGPPADEFGGPPDRGEAFWRSDDSASSSSSSVSDEEDDADAARGTARTKQTSDENDALLFDPDADDEDQRWADERRAVGRAEDPTTRDDDRDDDRCVLSCACCFVDVSVDASPASRRDDGRYVASRVTNVAIGDGGSEGPRRDPAEGRRGGIPFRCEACGEALGTVDGGGESRRRFRFDVGAVVPSTA